MVEKAKRWAPQKDTLRRLFALSGNQCAFPDCKRRLVDEDGTFVAQVCHTASPASNPAGVRPCRRHQRQVEPMTGHLLT
jgi:hypothetical protein